jgi:hypothetical protein
MRTWQSVQSCKPRISGTVHATPAFGAYIKRPKAVCEISNVNRLLVGRKGKPLGRCKNIWRNENFKFVFPAPEAVDSWRAWVCDLGITLTVNDQCIQEVPLAMYRHKLSGFEVKGENPWFPNAAQIDIFIGGLPRCLRDVIRYLFL